MRDYEPVLSFGKDVADLYDSDGLRGDETETVDYLVGLASHHNALELAIGTGRIGLRLAERGVPVTGIELSTAMAAKLAEKPGGDRIPLIIGDFVDVEIDDTFQLIYVVFNTFFNVLTQDDQVRCFQNVANHLTDTGVFVIETFHPAFLYRLRDDQYVDAERVEIDEVRLDVGRHDPVRQMLDESHVSLTPQGVRLYPVVCRYAWPSELDLMARIAGLRLHDRWGGWKGEAFTASSVRHISVYGR